MGDREEMEEEEEEEVAEGRNKEMGEKAVKQLIINFEVCHLQDCLITRHVFMCISPNNMHSECMGTSMHMYAETQYD